MGFKSALAMQGDPAMSALAADPAKLAEAYELKATLRRRDAELPLDQLSKLATQAVKRPRARVPAATFKQIDEAFAGLSGGAATTTAAQKPAGRRAGRPSRPDRGSRRGGHARCV